VLGLSDMGMPDQLYHYMVGGQKRPLVSTLKYSADTIRLISLDSEFLYGCAVCCNVFQHKQHYAEPF